MAGLALLVSCGCRRAATQSPGEALREAAQPEAIAGNVADSEDWYAVYLGGARVGYQQMKTTPISRGGRDLLEVTGLTRMTIPRDGQPTSLEDRVTSTETPDGRLVEFSVVSNRGPEPAEVSGRVAGDTLHLEFSTKGRKEHTSIPWSPEYGGFFAVEQSLMRAPMQPGERRTIRALAPELYVVAANELAARQYEPVRLLNGRYDLLRIDVALCLPDGQTVSGNLWTDRTGRVMKNRLDAAMSIEAYRVTRAEALEETEPARFDLVRDVKVPVDRAIPSPQTTKRARYRVTLDDRDPAAVFISGPSQRVESVDPHTAEVTVYAIRPGSEAGGVEAPADPPSDDDLRPNNWIQSDFPAIVAKAREVAPGERDPWQVAVALERAASELITRSGYTQAFATAAEVIEAGQGDCTEHAVLLAALARARGIPARLAIGLVYLDQPEPAFYYHMWTEVHVDGRWIPLDATRPQGGTGAGYLKMAHSNFKAASALSAFLPVIQVMGKLNIEVQEVE